jgi:hypothetical protein
VDRDVDVLEALAGRDVAEVAHLGSILQELHFSDTVLHIFPLKNYKY